MFQCTSIHCDISLVNEVFFAAKKTTTVNCCHSLVSFHSAYKISPSFMICFHPTGWCENIVIKCPVLKSFNKSVNTLKNLPVHESIWFLLYTKPEKAQVCLPICAFSSKSL